MRNTGVNHTALSKLRLTIKYLDWIQYIGNQSLIIRKKQLLVTKKFYMHTTMCCSEI